MKVKLIEKIGKADKEKDLAIQVEKPGDSFEHLVYLLNKYQNARKRQGTVSVKGRGEVSGGGAKPYRQKGTGNARRGTNRSPLRRGGSVIFGPHERDYSVRMNSKEVVKVFKVAFGEKQSVLRLIEIDDVLKTKDAVKIIEANAENADSLQKVLLITTPSDENIEKAYRNIKLVSLASVNDIPILKLLTADQVYVTKSAGEKLEAVLG